MLIRALFVAVFAAWAVPAWAQVTAEYQTATDTQYDSPHDLVLSPDKRFLFVADNGNDVVKILDPMSLKVLGSIGQGQLSNPHDVDFDEHGRLLVADTGNDRIAIFAVDGIRGELIGEISGLDSPEGVAAAGGRIYLGNVGNNDVWSWQDGKRLAKTGTYGSGPGQYIRPHDVDVDSEGNIYVSDPGNNRIKILDKNLKEDRLIGGLAYDFNEPKYFAFNSKNWLFVADEYNHQIKILEPNRHLVHTIGTGERGMGPDRFSQPEGVEVWKDNLWISDTGNNRIVRYRLGGLPQP